jgi:hypothetical protein
MREIISLGVGHLKALKDDEPFNSSLSVPVYIAEPAMILSLGTLFETQPQMQRKSRMANLFCSATNSSMRGYVYESLVLLVLMEQFGGKFTALGDVFHIKPSESHLESKKATLVALRRTSNNDMSYCQASFTSGASDRYGFKAKSPADVLDFFHDPRGRPFLLPDDHMGPDLAGFLQDETGELILVLVQDKIKPVLDPGTWLAATASTRPDFFYTMIVRLSPFYLCCSVYLPCLLCRETETENETNMHRPNIQVLRMT